MRARFTVTPGGTLLLAALAFVMKAGELAALLAAAAAHELGHFAAIHLCGGRVTRLKICATGAVIERSGASCEIFCALAGPLAGLAYAFAVASASPLSAGISLVMSAFNALPVRPLDGWRALAALIGEGPASLCSLAAAAFALLLGIILCASGFGFAPAAAGAALMLAQARA